MSELQKLLDAIESRAAANRGQDVVLCTVLREIVRDALGLPLDAPIVAPQPINFALSVPKEFPQVRVKYSPEDHVEIARSRLINSIDDLGRLIREDHGWASATPVPIERSN